MMSLFMHSLKMLVRNIKTYIALSTTIIISFGILLGYLIYVDSYSFNNNKDFFSVSSKLFVVEQQGSREKLQILQDMMDGNKLEYESCDYFRISVPQMQYGSVVSDFICTPTCTKEFYESVAKNSSDGVDAYIVPHKLKMIYGQKDFSLDRNQIIVNKAFYDSLGLKEKDLPYSIDLLLSDEKVDNGIKTFDIVGVCEDGEYSSKLHYGEDGKLAGTLNVFVSQDTLAGINPQDYIQSTYCTRIITDNQKEVSNYIDKLDLINCSGYNAQQEAIKQEKAEKETKSIVIIMLLLVLGVNMFSCLSNVISKRQYEIGIKRAIGASRAQIIMQFMVESMCILLVDIILSIWGVVNILIVYKIVYWYRMHDAWIVNFSKYSMASFLVSAVSITVLFSIILAYKATRVEVVSQLKCE